jgi:hypothetical protein
MEKRKLLRFEFCQKMVVVCGYEDVVIDPSKFPELEGKTSDEIGRWIMENRQNLGLKSYFDSNPRKPTYSLDGIENQSADYEIKKKDEWEYDDELYTLIGPINNNFRWENGIEHTEEHFMNFIREEEVDDSPEENETTE